MTRRPDTDPPIGAHGEQSMAAKSYQLTIDKKSEYWHFRVTGPNTPEVVRAYLADVYYQVEWPIEKEASLPRDIPPE